MAIEPRDPKHVNWGWTTMGSRCNPIPAAGKVYPDPPLVRIVRGCTPHHLRTPSLLEPLPAKSTIPTTRIAYDRASLKTSTLVRELSMLPSSEARWVQGFRNRLAIKSGGRKKLPSAFQIEPVPTSRPLPVIPQLVRSKSSQCFGFRQPSRGRTRLRTPAPSVQATMLGMTWGGASAPPLAPLGEGGFGNAPAASTCYAGGRIRIG